VREIFPTNAGLPRRENHDAWIVMAVQKLFLEHPLNT
jgi:hypothetical protein